MRRSSRLNGAITLLLLPAACSPSHVSVGRSAVALFNDQSVFVSETLEDPSDLWVQPPDLTRINGFVLKPEGACLDDLCVPLGQAADSALLITRADRRWFNVTELARILGQAFIVDSETNTWSFGQFPHTRLSFVENARAPDFSLTDRAGNEVRLSDYRGKKVMIVTWASW